MHYIPPVSLLPPLRVSLSDCLTLSHSALNIVTDPPPTNERRRRENAHPIRGAEFELWAGPSKRSFM